METAAFLHFFQFFNGRLNNLIRDGAKIAEEHNKVELKIVIKWNGNFSSDRLKGKKWSILERGRPFVPENFRLNPGLCSDRPDQNNETEDSLP